MIYGKKGQFFLIHYKSRSNINDGDLYKHSGSGNIKHLFGRDIQRTSYNYIEIHWSEKNSYIFRRK